MSKKGNRGTKEEVQNRILFGFQKAIRQSGSRDDNRPLSLAEQLAQLEKDQEDELINRLKAKREARERGDDRDSYYTVRK
jgi:hypothetical protein